MKNCKIHLLLMVFCLLCANACFVSSRKETVETSNTQTNSADNPTNDGANASADPQAEIRSVDFKNFTYEPSCAYEETKKVTVRKGEYTRDKGDDKMYFTVENITYGDVNGDQNEDAIVLTICNTGGTGQFSEGFIYGMKDGKPELLSRIEGGDRADGGLRSAKVENGLLVVERNGAGETGGACCPEFTVTTKYKLEGKNLKQIGGDAKRDLYPPQRVKFEKGAADTTLNIKLTNEEDIKRFVINAQVNQALTVESGSKDVSIMLVKGNADIQQDGNNILQATLKESGDFVVQVQKLGDKNVNTSVNFDVR